MQYKPKSGSDNHATPLVGHSKRNHLSLCFKAVEEEKKKKPKASNIILNPNRKKQAVQLLENNMQQWLNFQAEAKVSKMRQLKLSLPMAFLFAPLKITASQRSLLRC